MDIPDLVQEAAGGEEVEAGVNLGDEDLLVLTPTRTLLYRAEGLLSDEKIEEYPHDVERLDISEGRRKTKFTLEYVEGTTSFAVPDSRARQVLEVVFEGVLRAAGVTGDDESVAGVFRFSELTLVVTDGRVVKHVGAAEWGDDFEEYAFGDLTGLSFERGSVATEVVLEVDGRPQRIKTPNERAPRVQEVLREAVFAFHEVPSMADLEAAIGDEASAGVDDDADEGEDDIALEAGIDPLVGDESAGTAADRPASDGPDSTSEPEPGSRSGAGPDPDPGEPADADAGIGIDAVGVGTGSAGQPDAAGAVEPAAPASEEDLEELREELRELRSVVERQNDLLGKQHRTLKKLIDELGRGR